MNSNEFRKELKKIMPGYKWKVHRRSSFNPNNIDATGIQFSGFNRLSTLSVIRREKNGNVEYHVKSAGYGKRAPWLSDYTDGTLARALRGLQNHYTAVGLDYSRHAKDLENGRKPTDQQEGD